MRFFFFISCCLILIIPARAQKHITYYNDKWDSCAKETASFFRVAEKRDSLWVVQDYFITNQVQMTGTFLDDSLRIRHGHFVYFFRDGQKEMEGDEVLGKAEGKWMAWHKNGHKDSEGEMMDNKRNGLWKFYFENGKLSAQEWYANGKLVKAEFWNENGKKNKNLKETEHLPEFKGGQNALLSYIRKNVKYPEVDREKGNEGKVVVSFVVTPEGNISDIRVLESVSPAIDNEAVRVVGLMPQWKPGLYHNRPVNVKYTLPIVFKLQ